MNNTDYAYNSLFGGMNMFKFSFQNKKSFLDRTPFPPINPEAGLVDAIRNMNLAELGIFIGGSIFSLMTASVITSIITRKSPVLINTEKLLDAKSKMKLSLFLSMFGGVPIFMLINSHSRLGGLTPNGEEWKTKPYIIKHQNYIQ